MCGGKEGVSITDHCDAGHVYCASCFRKKLRGRTLPCEERSTSSVKSTPTTHPAPDASDCATTTPNICLTLPTTEPSRKEGGGNVTKASSSNASSDAVSGSTVPRPVCNTHDLLPGRAQRFELDGREICVLKSTKSGVSSSFQEGKAAQRKEKERLRGREEGGREKKRGREEERKGKKEWES